MKRRCVRWYVRAGRVRAGYLDTRCAGGGAGEVCGPRYGMLRDAETGTGGWWRGERGGKSTGWNVRAGGYVWVVEMRAARRDSLD